MSAQETDPAKHGERAGEPEGTDTAGHIAAGREGLIGRLAAQRAGGAASLALAWRQALGMLPKMAKGDLERLARALPRPATARHLARMLAREPDATAAIQEFFREVDDSAESLEAWLEAFGVLGGWLENTAHRPGFTQALGYLHCCAAVVDSGARYATLPATVATMLETYGFNPSGSQTGPVP